MDLLRTLEDKVAPGRAAVVTVDVQNDFCHDNGFLGKCGAPLHLVKAMLPRLVSLLDAARANAVPVIHVISYHDEEYASPVVTEQKLRHNLPMELNGRKLRDAPYCLKGSWGAELTAIDARPGEEIVIKHRYSGFHGTNLDLVLRSRGIQTVILTGVATNACVESTARDTYMHDYYLVFVGDGCATTSQAAHDATLANIDQFFGEVATSNAIMATWAAKQARLRIAAAGR
ncbi:MAG: cysteine hydrolase [Betaproteobacteria bacterium]|nr:cysteine hydrolase [Betaproteobacteria bacterium]